MDKIAEIKERAELMNLRKRVEDQRHEIIRLMGVIDSQRGIIADQGKQIKQLEEDKKMSEDAIAAYLDDWR